jgi:PAS domain S-box-containing protein
MISVKIDMNLENKTIKDKQTEEALKISETRYRRLFETAKDGILMLDAGTGQIIDVNPFLLKMLGYTKEDFLGKNLWEIGPFKDIDACKTAFKELQTKEYIRYEYLPLETQDRKQIDVEFISNVYTVDNEKIIQCNIRDITDRKKSEKEIKKRVKELEEFYAIAVGRELRMKELKDEMEQLKGEMELLKRELNKCKTQ